MEQLGNVIAAIVVFSSLWLVRLLTKREIQHEDNLKELTLDDYERDLDKIFDYSKVKTISLHQEDSTGESSNDENISGMVEQEKIPGLDDLQ
jgi:site-specific recombinase XerC